ncbi:hypothetical protein [Actinoplanes subtropicus]|uniref:hypothetical protein n=1 Tax=Actinoplanes subtropicus TaxID=543632 RepID=UPI0004C316AD|nr:hypothetical protein [Actinoplanes subtropicus]
MIERHTVDGVPALLAPPTGPTRAGLAFRVGQVDEPLARRGITRLAAHDGAVGPEFTSFHVQGDESATAAFLTGVCASLREPPTDRLAALAALATVDPLRAEPLWRRRHGARDYGLAAYPEWGLPAITEDDLREWVGRWFTRENAVLWVAGDRIPAGLRLDLPSGIRHDPPAPSSALSVTPAFFSAGPDLIGWSAVAPRSAATSVFAALLERMMSRDPRVDQQPLGADTMLVSAIADALPGALIDLLATLRVGRVDEADLTAVVAERIEALRHAEETTDRLRAQAFRLLLGREVEQLEDEIARLRAVTVADVAEVATAAWRTVLLMSPTPADWAGFAAAPTYSASAVPGTTYRSLEDENRRLIVGEEGVSTVDAENLATVRAADCVLMRSWPDGARHLLGPDGIDIRVEPTLFANGPAAVAAIDALIAPGIRVDQPARDTAQIPRPRARARGGPAWWRELAQGWRRAHWRLRWSFAGALIGAVGFTVVAGQAAIESARTSDALYTLAVAVLCVGVFGRAAWKRAALLRAT